eukprot:gene59663-79595_t
MPAAEQASSSASPISVCRANTSLTRRRQSDDTTSLIYISFGDISSAFADNGTIPAEHAGAGECGGKNISPPVAWSNLPPKTRSVAVLVFDPDGAAGLGVSHWVAYNIAAERGELKT